MKEKDYSDIIDLPHYISKNRNPMPLYQRAAQFAPFSALRGYEETLLEVARQTQEKICLSDHQMDIICCQLQVLKAHLDEQNEVTIQYFQKDKNKKGGEYKRITGKIKKFDLDKQTIILTDNQSIELNTIIEIDSSLFTKLHME